MFPAKPTIPSVSKEIQEIRVEDPGRNQESLALELVPRQKEESPLRLHIEIGKENRILYPEKAGTRTGTGMASVGDGDGSSRPMANELALGVVVGLPEVSHLGWGQWYTMRELEEATGGFSPDNVIGEGGYGIVYRGMLEDSTQIAVKNLLNNRSVCIPFEDDLCNVVNDLKFPMEVLLSQGPSREGV